MSLRFETIDHQSQRCLLVEFRGPDGIDRGDRECPCNVIESGLGKLLGFIERRHGNSARAQLHLMIRNLDAFMRFDMGAKGNAKGIRPLLHPGEVPLEDFLVEQKCGRGKFMDGHGIRF